MTISAVDIIPTGDMAKAFSRYAADSHKNHIPGCRSSVCLHIERPGISLVIQNYNMQTIFR